MNPDIQERLQWLRQNTPLGALSEPVLAALAAEIQVEQWAENRRLVLEDTMPAALYILRAGRLEAYRTQTDSLAAANSLLPGAVLHVKALLLDQPAEQTVITLADSELWSLSRQVFLDLAAKHPEIGQTFSRYLASELDALAAQLAFERERQVALRPYLVPKVRQGVVGASRYAVRLRQAIKKAASDRQAALVFGEPGLGKDNIAALIHFGSADRKQPLIKVNCDLLQASGSELFGRVGGKSGLLEWLGSGSLMLNNAEALPQLLSQKILHLLETGEYRPVVREGDPEPPLQRSDARILLTSERNIPEIERCKKIGAHLIKVPPVRVAKADIAAQVTYFISLYCRSHGLPQPQVAPEAIRRLQGYDFPGNLTELENLVTRAIAQSDAAPVLTEEVFWSASSKAKRFRLNLLDAYPKLRQFLRSPWWPDRINYGLTLWLFPIIVAIGLFGPQTRDQNLALNLFWAWWWPVMLILFPFLGRIWCSVCPFMIYGELSQKLSLRWWPRQLRPWPRQEAERWGGWFIFGLFALILLWEELWNLENTASLSSCLLLLITAGAVIFSLLFERRFWCRYLCPIGGMNGLFGKLAIIELRAQQGICAATCTTYQCYKGGPEKGEGQETGGCPVYSHPAQLQDNRDCVLCMTCLKACPHRSVALNLRPPGIELWTTHTATAHEIALLLLLFGAVFLHRLPELNQRLGWNLPLEQTTVHTGFSLLALLIPAAVVLLADRALRLGFPKAPAFVTLAYGYLPLVLGSSLAHYLDLGLSEAGQIMPVSFATFGYGSVAAPVVVAHPAVIAFLQGVTLIAAAALSVILSQKISRQPWVQLWPQHAAILGLTVLLWQLIL
ncbi:MAG: sigma 54-interacting transcriptional regulator [Pegethrix bostrychoides GSE-TBD4-15B]|uniref:Sigma 54-interacting transcriptional regulator n=1 Tax=Pegethrix bostrychoides GSE-TBD4-15B TaxID=2839662 RepID=A0A951P9H2_9CYAN|nr:sigma 54-interacting transcriptional regulator [Pegethrix bostrychoides GSE-TBD4-15B]